MLHLVDYLVTDRRRVQANDLKEKEVEGKVTLDNVFELAGNEVEESDESDNLI